MVIDNHPFRFLAKKTEDLFDQVQTQKEDELEVELLEDIERKKKEFLKNRQEALKKFKEEAAKKEAERFEEIEKSGMTVDQFKQKEYLDDLFKSDYIKELNKDIPEDSGYSFAILRYFDRDPEDGSIDGETYQYIKVPTDEDPEKEKEAGVDSFYTDFLEEKRFDNKKIKKDLDEKGIKTTGIFVKVVSQTEFEDTYGYAKLAPFYSDITKFIENADTE